MKSFAQTILMRCIDPVDPSDRRYLAGQCLIVALITITYAAVKAPASPLAAPFAANPLLSSHFVDFLAPWVLFAASNACFFPFGFKVVRLAPIVGYCLIGSLVWELAAPCFLAYSVADPKDVAAYLLGGLCYWLAFRTKA